MSEYQLVPRPPRPPRPPFVSAGVGDMDVKPERRPADALLLGAVCLGLATICRTQRLCVVPPGPVSIAENNTADVTVVEISTNIDLDPPPTLTLTVNPEDLFYLNGNVLMVKRGLDYESLSSSVLTVWLQCRADSRSVNESVEVLVENINDNPPNFAQNHYILDVNELTPVNASVGLIQATDVDSDPLFYRLEPATDKYFRLENINSPKIVVKSIIDYDSVQKISLVLHVQDTFNGSASNKPFFTSVATITVNVKDVDNRPPWFQPCIRTNLGISKLCVSGGYRGKVNLTEREDGPLVLEPGPVFAKDGDKNRSEQISYKILRGNEGNIFQIDEESGNISMAKAADILGPITLTVIASQVTNRDQFAVTQVTIEVMKKSRNPPRFEKERYEGFIYSNSAPESMILRDRSTNRPFRVRARDEDFATGVNPDVKYEVQYSSYVNVTSDGFVVLKRVVKTESFALQLRAVDSTTGEFGTAALSVQVIPAVAIPSPSNTGYRPGDMALLGLVMAALLVLCLIVIGFLLSRLLKGNGGVDKICECLGPCFATPPVRSGHRDSLQYTNDGFQNEADAARGRRWNDALPRRSSAPSARGRVIPLERRSRHCSSCGVYSNHVPKGSPAVRSARGGRGDNDDDYGARSILSKQRRREGQKTVWFKESEDSSDIEVEIIPDTVGRVEEEPEEEPEGEGEMDGVVRDPAAPLREENQNMEEQDQDRDNTGPDTEKENKKQEG
ncbi:cadherin-related family member 5-like [Sphaeramia orbicularis]|uniref:cadherin-related family member 5-like n=1 Tax=Sphaeramia orbicularis TaxID=375764 RepID=UPI00117C847F|nr:cadherin-related family member 5-like [Sphaeramia orbicularis]XP_029977844.1 cadherin-related family member 5-like [Sphaeramia orbicularis]